MLQVRASLPPTPETFVKHISTSMHTTVEIEVLPPSLENFHPGYAHKFLEPRTGEDLKGHLIIMSSNTVSPLVPLF